MHRGRREESSQSTNRPHSEAKLLGAFPEGWLREMGVRGRKMSICSIPSFVDLRAISDPTGSKAGGSDGAGDTGPVPYYLPSQPSRAELGWPRRMGECAWGSSRPQSKGLLPQEVA